MNKKTILITGGTGFLGRALAIALKNEYKVFICGRNNTQNLWAQQDTNCEFLPMDVSQIESVKDVINETSPEIIIHAAATKFVDFSEKFPNEAIDINILGSQNIARVAIDKKVETVIGISTDKAAPPLHNIYSMTKALMERLYSSLNSKSITNFACVRFGNIVWSSGSVFPIWDKMLADTGEIKSTGPHMKRYFFTVEDAVNLVITCLENIETLKGTVLTKDMKVAVMEDILNVWTKEFGGKWTKVEERPGDSLGEYLVGDSELKHTTPITIEGELYYKIDFNNKSESPVNKSLNTDTAEKLNDVEILKLINAKTKTHAF